jgi:hypothetical protein
LESNTSSWPIFLAATPNLLPSDEFILDQNDDEDGTAREQRQQQQSLVTLGANITITMVVVASGFCLC